MSLYTLLASIIGLLIVIYFYLVRKQKYWERRGIPTAKSKHVLLFGHMWPLITFQKSLGEVVEDCYNSIPNSSMIGLYNFGNPELLIRDPNLIKTIFQTNFASFYKNGFALDPKKNPLLSQHPFFTEGEIWKNSRSVLTNTMSTAKLKNMTIGVNEVCTKFHEYLQQQIKLNNGLYDVKSEELFSRFTAEVIAKVGFGIDGNSFKDQPGNFLEVVKTIFDPTGLLAFKQMLIFFYPPLGKILDTGLIPVKIDHYLRGVVKEVLELRKQSGIRGNDFIQHINDSYKSKLGEIDDIFITGHSVAFMVDGYMSTSYTLSFAAYELAKHPQVQQKLREEIKQVLKKHDNKITYEAIQDMKYMDLVIQESMRMLSILPMLARVCTEEFKLIGCDGLECVVRPGDKVIFSPPGIHKDSKYWENSETFNPERFKEDSKNELYKFINIPFGGGPRACPGMRLAMLQMKGALTELIDNFEIELSSKTKLPFTYEISGFVNAVKGGIWIKIKPL